jgi:DNA-binding CsgD family transcriptional regulator
MLTWNEIVQDYIIKFSDRIRQTTQPLRERFGIDYFTYHRIDDSGKYTVLVDRPDWAEHYVHEQIYLNDPYLRHPSGYQSGISLIDTYGSKEFLEKLLDSGKKVLNVDLGAFLIQKKEGSVEFFGFSANKEKSSLQSLYLNHPQILRSFAAHFTRNLQSVLQHMSQEASSLIDLKGDDFFSKQSICPDIVSSTRFDFYKDLGMKCEMERLEKLSKRERQCLKLLTESKSAKQTAAALGLSPRTVESYFENIKVKLCCWSKHEVLELARYLDELGFLP